MGYSMPLVCKEIYLPIDEDDSNLSLEEYKNKYGIDLKEYLIFSGGYITFMCPLNTKLFINVTGSSFKKGYQFPLCFIPNSQDRASAWVSGDSDGNTMLGSYQNEAWVLSISFDIGNDVEGKIDNIKVSFYSDML